MSTADERAAAYRGASRRLQIDIAALDEYLRPMVLVARIVATGLVAPAAVLLTEHVNDDVFGRQARRLVNSLNGNLKQHLSVAVEASSRSANERRNVVEALLCFDEAGCLAASRERSFDVR